MGNNIKVNHIEDIRSEQEGNQITRDEEGKYFVPESNSTLDVRMVDLASDLDETEQSVIATKLNLINPTEGTFTPVLSSTSGTYTQTSTGYYYKVGKMVTINITILNISTNTASGISTQITGLPFSCRDKEFHFNIIATIATPFYQLLGRMNGTSIMDIHAQTNLDGNNYENIAIETEGGSMIISGTYITT